MREILYYIEVIKLGSKLISRDSCNCFMNIKSGIKVYFSLFYKSNIVAHVMVFI